LGEAGEPVHSGGERPGARIGEWSPPA
jgi:hypothetical protein